MGGVYLLVGMLGFALSVLLGLSSYGVEDNTIHVLVGILSLAVAFTSGRGTTSRA